MQYFKLINVIWVVRASSHLMKYRLTGVTKDNGSASYLETNQTI